MRCPDCNKFVSFDDTTDPDVEVDLDGSTVAGTVRIVLTCQECGTELKEATFDVEADHDDALKDHVSDGDDETHELELEVLDQQLTSRTEGKGRGVRTYYGAEIQYQVTCKCQAKDAGELVSGSWADDLQASAMDEMT